MGVQSSKVCYIDNPNGQRFLSGADLSIDDQFKSGFELDLNGQGICSDCHAGENPFIVHRNDAPFDRLKAANVTLRTDRWPDHMVHPLWPNVGPLNGLGPVPTGEAKCESCHVNPKDGRFPLVSLALPEYCDVILPLATSITMPSADNGNLYRTHITRLTELCDKPAKVSKIVPDEPSDDPKFLSPPIVFDPIYQCARKALVRGARLGADVELFVNGVSAGVKKARLPSGVEFDFSRDFRSTDIVNAKQYVGGAQSDFSENVEVRRYQEDYPDGLPAPTIVPKTIYECASNIAVDHVEGAFLTVTTERRANMTDDRTGGGATGYTVAQGNGPFEVDDKFTVTQRLCDDTSPPSVPEYALPAPKVLRKVAFDPPTFYEEQQVMKIISTTEGADIDIWNSGGQAPIGRFFSWPASRASFDIVTGKPTWGPGLGRGLVQNERLVVTQKLCDRESPPAETPAAKGCGTLLPPQLATPLGGDQSIVVSESAPGATIRVWAQDGEIGDGGEDTIWLKRRLQSGETLLVRQQLGVVTPENQATFRIKSKVSRNSSGLR